MYFNALKLEQRFILQCILSSLITVPVLSVLQFKTSKMNLKLIIALMFAKMTFSLGQTIPDVPCPQYFQYDRYKGQIIGRVQFPNLNTDAYNLKVTCSVRGTVGQSVRIKFVYYFYKVEVHTSRRNIYLKKSVLGWDSHIYLYIVVYTYI